MTSISSARRSFVVTVSITGLMLLLNIVALIAHFGFSIAEDHGLVRLLNMEYERNIPTAWSAMLLLYASALLTGVGRMMFGRGDRYRWHWLLLGVAFFYLAMDESFELHEKSMRLTSAFFAEHVGELGGVFYYSWIIPAGIALFLMGLFFLGFTFSLPARTRNLFIISCVIYAGSAMGFEMLQGPLDKAGNWMALPYAILVMVEETLEMFGICLFTYAVIDFRESRR